MNLQDLYQELIIDHGTQPRNCCCLANATNTAEGFNPLCGDKINVYLKITELSIQTITFTGKGCAISMASASLMTEVLLGKTLAEANAIAHAFKILLTEDAVTPTENDQKSLDNTINNTIPVKLNALAGVKAFPARVKCATLAWHTLLAALPKQNILIQKSCSKDLDLKSKKPVSTEDQVQY